MKKINTKDIFQDFHNITSGIMPVQFEKADHNAFYYSVWVELTLDKDERLATKGRITFKNYLLGSKTDAFGFVSKVTFNDTIPSHIQKRFETLGMTTSLNVKEMEEEIVRKCIIHYNWMVKDKEYKEAHSSFMTRKDQFIQEFKALKEKYGIEMDLETSSDYDGNVEIDVILTDKKFTERAIESYEDAETFFEG